MKRFKLLTYAIILALLMLSFFSPMTATIARAATVSISNKTATIEKGKSKALKITGTKSKVTWSSNKKSVATVSSSGTVTAKATGTAVITASVNGKKYTCNVTVILPINISNKTYTLEVGKTYKLKISGSKNKVTWTSTKTSVATVSSSGTITARATGKATITAKVDGKSLTCAVTVKPASHPYLIKAPFDAKVIDNKPINMVIPKNWSTSIDTTIEDMYFISIVPDNEYSDSYMDMAIFRNRASNNNFDELKDALYSFLTETNLRSQFDSMLNGSGITDYTLDNFENSDIKLDFGNIFKNKYSLTILGLKSQEITYYFYQGEYYIQVTISNAGGEEFEKITEYIVNSLRVK